MAEAVVSLLVERLGDWLIDKAKILCGVSDQVQQLQVELKRMQCFLKDADKRRDEREIVRQLVAEIREVACDAEDVIEVYALEVASTRKGDANNFFQKFTCTLDEGIQSLNVGPKIKEITSKISNLTTLLQTYGIKECGPNPLIERQREQRQTFAHVEDIDVVGFEENIEELVECLVTEEKQYRVVSICGMGGLGKTTLAKKVYHHHQVKNHFDCRAWVYISQQCQRRQVWEGILSGLLSQSDQQRDGIQNLRDDKLAKKLYEIQQQQKCLVILDDIWSAEAWDLISAAFPISTDTGSKIVLTSRNREVALHVDPRRFPHEPQCLNDEQSWELLHKKAISWREGSECKTNMEELGKEMVRCCKGLPLAITILGGLLATKHTLEEWKEVHGHVMLDLHERKDQRFSQVLTLSYDDLPYHLKPCFLYLGHFPEDFEISTKKLIRMWMAEGFISPMQGTYGRVEKMEDTGELYLRQLIQRCLVQVGKRDLMSERIKTCRVHDIMRDLCLSKAKEENFLQCIKHRPKENEAAPIGKVRRFSIYCDEVPIKLIPLIYKECPYIRSLLYFPLNSISIQNEQLMSSMFKDFKLLRVLNFKNSISGQYWVPKEIGHLIHLRFLTISGGNLARLPSSISNLRCLQTLDVRISTIIKEIKAKMIQKMEQLRHLYLPYDCVITGKLQLANLSHLQTLVNIPLSLCDLEDLAKLTNLTKLRIRLKGTLEKDEKIHIPTLEILRSLRVDIVSSTPTTDIRPILSSCPHLYKLFVQGKIEKLPEVNQISPNLTKLILVATSLEEDPMPTLEKLPKLKILNLDIWAFEGKNMVCSARGFPQLQSLSLNSLYSLEEWTVEEGAMLSLCRLEIVACQQLKMVPEGLRFVTTLQELKIRYMPKEFKDFLSGHSQYTQPPHYAREQRKLEDGYNWRKYGQKQVKGSEYPRTYCKCTYPNCPTKKKLERSLDGQITEIVYKGYHHHPKPQSSRGSSSQSIQPSSCTNSGISDQSVVTLGQMEPVTMQENRKQRKSVDGYNWRKYGQKQVKGIEFSRTYYKCTYPNCPTKKTLERSLDGQITEIVYKGYHNHPKPQSSRGSSSQSIQPSVVIY